MAAVPVISLARTEQRLATAAFITPLVPYLPTLAIFINTYLIFQLPDSALYRLVIWTTIGMIIYVFYGVSHSKLGKKQRGEYNEDTAK